MNKMIRAEDISVVIPVKDNAQGIEQFLKNFFLTQNQSEYPAEIILVDNNSKIPLSLGSEYSNCELDIKICHCSRPGPASARNVGVSEARGSWILFVDSDCIPTSTLISGYLNDKSEAVAYQGYVGALGKDYVSRYYESQQILRPPAEIDGSPRYLVTANALVKKSAFDQLEGFCEEFILAGGEDIDLGFRLKKLGKLAFANQVVVQHEFEDNLLSFIKRMIRYGKGNRMVRHFHKNGMLPLPSMAKDKSVMVNHFLVVLQWLALLYGYTRKSLELWFSTPKNRVKVEF